MRLVKLPLFETSLEEWFNVDNVRTFSESKETPHNDDKPHSVTCLIFDENHLEYIDLPLDEVVKRIKETERF